MQNSSSVYKAKLKLCALKPGEKERFYALKKIIKQKHEGFPITALRELQILSKLSHPNIVHLKEVVSSRPNKTNKNAGSIYMVFEYMEYDLNGLLEAQTPFELRHIKCILKQLLQGLAYLHRHGVLHRDIKSANILMNRAGEAKLADFGLAKFCDRGKKEMNTPRVVTLWYRPPELLMGAIAYTLCRMDNYKYF